MNWMDSDDYDIHINLNEVSASIRSKQIMIENFWLRFQQLNGIYSKNRTDIEQLKAFARTGTKNGRLKKISRFQNYPNFTSITFKNNEFWIEQLVAHYRILCRKWEEAIESQQKEIKILEKIVKHIKCEAPLPAERIKFDKTCRYCQQSILMCPEHRNESHDYEYINHDALQQLIPSAVIAIDTENVTSLKEYKRPMVAFRVAAVTDHPIKINNQTSKNTLLYHAFWKPPQDFLSYQPITGIGVQEIKRNLNNFTNRSEGRSNLFNHVVKRHLLVFANAKSDILSIGFPSYPPNRDIQMYFVRNPGSKNPMPFGLKWLTKHVLQRNINENGPHNPLLDAQYTLQLYRKIPKEFWQKEPKPNWFKPIPLETPKILANIIRFNRPSKSDYGRMVPEIITETLTISCDIADRLNKTNNSILVKIRIETSVTIIVQPNEPTVVKIIGTKENVMKAKRELENRLPRLVENASTTQIYFDDNF